MRFAMNRYAKSVALICTAAWPGLCGAFQPLVTDDTGTQGAGGNQIEAAYNRTVERAAGARAVVHEVPLVYTRGITEALDLYFGGAYQRLTADGAPTERGWGNTAFGAKWRFYENETSKLSLALKPEVQFPVSKSRELRGLGAARASYALGLLMTQETGFGAVHANLAAEKIDYADAALDAAERRTRYRASLAPVWDVTEQWKLALDAGIVTNPERTAKRYFGYVEVGAIYSPSKGLDFALGIIRNVRDGEARTTLATVGVTWRFR
jgi:hypothetical protein